MGSANSKVDGDQALSLCKARKKFIKQAIESRYLLAAVHVSYTQSLRNVGVALRRYSEAEILIESSLSTSATELEKTPSHCSFPSPSPSHLLDVSDSPSPPMARLSYMKSMHSEPFTVSLKNPVLGTSRIIDDGNAAASALPAPPPPPYHEFNSSWDYFDPADEAESFRFVEPGGADMEVDDLRGWPHFKGENTECLKFNSVEALNDEPSTRDHDSNTGLVLAIEDANAANGLGKGGSECKNSKKEKPIQEKEANAEREDPSEFITHRAKDFLSSIKDIEHKFFRASESGRELSRMLEANKIKLGFPESKGESPSSAIKAAYQLVCGPRKQGIVSHETGQQGMKMIIWKRSMSWASSSSRNPLAGATKDDVSDSGSDFVEDFCMISGSHSSTLDRLYAWEMKLHDEVQASESIRKVYDRKCDQLKHQFAKGCSSQVIDKTRASVKDLHSRIIVALHSVDAISKRIEKMRDEELQPQLVELVHGFIRMWKAMLECHHAQYITISLAYHSRAPAGTTPRGGESRKQVMAQLRHEIECFGSSFTNWVNSLYSYIEALNGWLQNCILLPPEPGRARHRRPWSPRRALAPPIFVLCRDWLAGLKALSGGDDLAGSLKGFLSDINDLIEEDVSNGQREADHGSNAEVAKDEERSTLGPSNLSFMHTSLSKVLDRMTKFSESSLKMYEDVRQKSDVAMAAYSNSRPVRSKTMRPTVTETNIANDESYDLTGR